MKPPCLAWEGQQENQHFSHCLNTYKFAVIRGVHDNNYSLNYHHKTLNETLLVNSYLTITYLSLFELSLLTRISQ